MSFRKKQTLWLALLAGAFILVLAGCGGGSSSPATPSKSPAGAQTEPASPGGTTGQSAPATSETSEYKIGVINSLTGDKAAGGKSQQAGYKAALEVLGNEIDGHPVKLVEIDDQSSPDLAARAAEDLALQGVPVIIGPTFTPTAYAAEAVAERVGVPMISTSGGYEPSQGVKWSWAPTPHLEMQAIKYFEYAKAHGATKVATITSTDSLGDLMEGLFTKYFGQNPDIKQTARIRIGAKDIDYTPQLIKLKGDKPDLIFTMVAGQAVYQVRKQLNQVGLENVPMIISIGNTHNEMKRMMAEYKPGTALVLSPKFVVAGQLPNNDPQKNFYERIYSILHDSTKTDPEGLAMYGFDTMMVAAEALKAAGPDRAKINEWLEGAHEVVGVGGTIKLTKEDRIGVHVPDAVIMLLIDDKGQWAIAK